MILPGRLALSLLLCVAGTLCQQANDTANPPDPPTRSETFSAGTPTPSANVQTPSPTTQTPRPTTKTASPTPQTSRPTPQPPRTTPQPLRTTPQPPRPASPTAKLHPRPARVPESPARNWDLATIPRGHFTTSTPQPKADFTVGDGSRDFSMRALSDLPLESTEDHKGKAGTETESGEGTETDQQEKHNESVDMELSPSNPGTLPPRAADEGGNMATAVPGTAVAAGPDSAAAANSSQPQCTRGGSGSCDYNNFERCSEIGTCQCLRGYRREEGTGKCLAAQYFRGSLRLANEFKPQMQNKNSEDFRSLETQLRQVLFSSLESQGVAGLMGAGLVKVEPREGSAKAGVVTYFELALERNAAAPLETLQRMYNRGLTSVAFLDTDGQVKLTGTSLVLGRNASMAQYLDRISEYNHCVDPMHNYCSPQADCTHSMRFFTCQCSPGFVDTSPDIYRAPGEQCSVPCRCRNNGSCENVNGEVVCRCPQWFLGSDCEINGKELLIICTSVLAGLVVLTILLCLVCVCTSKSRSSRKSSRASTVGVGTLDTSVVKLPRVWMDGQRPYDLPPRPDTRRWSYVSEPVRYVDEYMMDDYVHSETLPLPRPNNTAKKPYYSAYSNSGYSSSTLSMPPRPRHY